MISFVTAENSGGGKNLTEENYKYYMQIKVFAMKEVNTREMNLTKLNLQSTYVNDENETEPRFNNHWCQSILYFY